MANTKVDLTPPLFKRAYKDLNRNLDLARQNNCENLLRRIIEFIPAAKSPPLARKPPYT